MRALQNLEQSEQQVKTQVHQKITEGLPLKRKRYVPQIVAVCSLLIAAMLLFLMINSSAEPPVVHTDADFSFSELTIGTLDIRESYFIAAAVSWNGNEEATLSAIELVDNEGNVIGFQKDHIAISVFDTNLPIKPGLYLGDEIDDFEEFSKVSFQPQSERMLLFNVIANTEFTQRDDLQVKLTFQVNGEEHLQQYQWASLNTIEVDEFNFDELITSLHVSSEELVAYEAFKESKDSTTLKSLTPMNIARLYLLAEIEGDSKLQYAFYTTQAEWVAWSYDEQLAFPPTHTQSLIETVQLFKDLSDGTFVHTSEIQGYISFSQENSEPLAGFQMIRNEEDIWQVAFMPMQ